MTLSEPFADNIPKSKKKLHYCYGSYYADKEARKGQGPPFYGCFYSCSRAYNLDNPFPCACPAPEFIRYCWEHKSDACGCQEKLILMWRRREYYGEKECK